MALPLFPSFVERGRRAQISSSSKSPRPGSRPFFPPLSHSLLCLTPPSPASSPSTRPTPPRRRRDGPVDIGRQLLTAITEASSTSESEPVPFSFCPCRSPRRVAHPDITMRRSSYERPAELPMPRPSRTAVPFQDHPASTAMVTARPYGWGPRPDDQPPQGSFRPTATAPAAVPSRRPPSPYGADRQHAYPHRRASASPPRHRPQYSTARLPRGYTVYQDDLEAERVNQEPWDVQERRADAFFRPQRRSNGGVRFAPMAPEQQSSTKKKVRIVEVSRLPQHL